MSNPTLQFSARLLGDDAPWRRDDNNGCRLWRSDSLALLPCPVTLDDALDALRQPVFGALMAEDGVRVAAAVDHCRTRPLFYARTPDQGLVVGGDARAVTKAAGLDPTRAPSAGALLDAALTGYVTGGETLCPGLFQLRPGEALTFDKATRSLSLHRHYQHDLTAGATAPVGDRAAWRRRLLERLDAAFDRTVERAAGRPILVPLSGGLDSRLILGKLVERGYRDLRAFSYGPKNNYDALIAREVACRLDVPWTFVDTPGPVVRRFHRSEERLRYWDFADGLCSVPNGGDIVPLLRLRESGALPADAFVVNGQSGDFLTGGHVSPSVAAGEGGWDSMFESILKKHYALWLSLRTPANLDLARARIRAVVGLPECLPPDPGPDVLANLMERWEYEERQSKYVVSGQRVYDFLDLGWDLPLWDRELSEFYRGVPLPLRVGQTLYREALEDWDYRGLYTQVRRKVQGWSPAQRIVMDPMAVALRLVVGRARRDALMKYTAYFGRFGHHYRAFGLGEFLRHSRDQRNPVSFWTMHWLDGLGLWRKVPR